MVRWNTPTSSALLVLSLGWRTAAQVASNVTCSASSVWMQNARGQNPCLVAAYLSSVCNNGGWTVPTLNALNVAYNSPGGTNANSCRCNTVVYSLLQACAVCQGGTALSSWTTWPSLCASADISKTYPNAVPPQTVIPGWAFLDPVTTGGGTWNATAAQAYAAASTPKTTTQPASDPKKAAPVGAIVGGVLGGLAVLAGAAWGIWICIQRSPVGKGQRVRAATHSDAGLTETVRDEGIDPTPATKYRPDMSTQVPLMTSYYTHDANAVLPHRQSTTVPYRGEQPTYPNYATNMPYSAPSAYQQYPQQPPQGPIPQSNQAGRPYAPRRLSGGYTGVAEI